MHGSLENGAKWRWGAVASISMSTATTCATLMGVAGHLGLMDETQGDVLNNSPNDSTQANASRGLLAIAMFCLHTLWNHLLQDTR